MEVIRATTNLSSGDVVFHTAFGFARIVGVSPQLVQLEWENPVDGLPTQLARGVLDRVYSRCTPEGLLLLSVADPSSARRLVMERSSDALYRLLVDLGGAPQVTELLEWLIQRRLLAADQAEAWWTGARAEAEADPRLVVRDSQVELAPLAPSAASGVWPGALAALAQMAIEHRAGEALRYWRLLGPPPDSEADQVRALIPEPPVEALVNADDPSLAASVLGFWPFWRSEDLDTLALLAVGHALRGGSAEAAGPLLARLRERGAPAAADLLSGIALEPRGKRLIRATCAALPSADAFRLVVELLGLVRAHGEDQAARWLAAELMGMSLLGASQLAARLGAERPALAAWVRAEFGSSDTVDTTHGEDSSEESVYTAEVDWDGISQGPRALAELRARPGASLLGLSHALCRVLGGPHREGHALNPTRSSVLLRLSDENIEVDPRRSLPDELSIDEPEGPSRDVWMAGRVLLESLLGRAWPKAVAPCEALPALRLVVDDLPPSSLGPLESALHPEVNRRPKDALVWRALWQQSTNAEEARAASRHNPEVLLRAGFDSHIGRAKLLLGQTNQDTVFVASRGALSLLLVCDGISTATIGSGDIASGIARAVIASVWQQSLEALRGAGPELLGEVVDRALRNANTAICEASLRLAGGDLQGRVPMGTTALVALVWGNLVHLAWLGDSRAYLVGPYGASLLTADENQAAERLKAFQLGLSDRWSGAGFALVGYLGHFNEEDQPEALPAHHTEFLLLPGERLVLTSDGVTDYLASEGPEVARRLSLAALSDSPDDAAATLVLAANRGGGGDNASCIVAQLG